MPHQRCLTHVQRQLFTFLPARSPLLATRALRRIASYLFDIETPQDLAVWKQMLTRWEDEYGYLSKERAIVQESHTRSWWFAHGNLRRAMKLLHCNEQHLFAYLAHPVLPKTNNSLEGVNSQIKCKLSNHRGMKTPQQVIYIFLLLTFSRVKTRGDLTQLWDRLT
ncbi:transposase [Candidatus Roizmanbacteria bacterium]|nr:transposase [Candidatus Roizmanbacteria bacterium]